MKEAVRLGEIGVGGGNAEAVRAMFDSIEFWVGWVLAKTHD